MLIKKRYSGRIWIFFVLISAILFSTCQAVKDAEETPIPRWVEYQMALGKAIISQEAPSLCEWEIWKVDAEKVYAWALCETVQIDPSTQAAGGSAPVIIFLSKEGNIDHVIVPKVGSDYEELFPKEILVKITLHGFDAVSAAEHIAKRRENLDIPPMIIETGIPLP